MRTFNVLLILSIFLSGLSAQLLTCKKVSASLDKTILLHETGPLEETYIFIKKNSGKTIGQYLFFHSRDHGPLIFSLKDLSNPIPLDYILPDNAIPFVPVLFYDLQENNSYILIFASSSNFECNVNYNIIAENIKLKQKVNNTVDYHISMQHYVVMYLVNPKTRCSNLIADLKKGEILNCEKDSELINNILKNINE